jgi:hypothetical protein
VHQQIEAGNRLRVEKAGNRGRGIANASGRRPTPKTCAPVAMYRSTRALPIPSVAPVMRIVDTIR